MLTTATFISQLIPFLIYPIIARVFTPEDFGLLALFTSITPIMAIIASGAFEHALILDKSDKEQEQLIRYLLKRILIINTIFFLIIFLTSFYKIAPPEILKLGIWIFALPVVSLSITTINIFNEHAVKNKHFLSLSGMKVSQSLSTTILKLFFSFNAFFNKFGLIIGEVFGKIFTAFVCLAIICKSFRLHKQSPYQNKLSAHQKYSDFQKIMLPEQLINLLGGSIHVFFIAYYFNSEVLGYFAMILTILTVPVTVVSSAIKDVFRQKAAESIAKNNSCKRIYSLFLLPISLISLVGFTLVYFFLEPMIDILLGPTWYTATVYGKILIPLYFFNFISMSLSGVFIVTKRLNISLYWQIFSTLSIALSFIVGGVFLNGIEQTLVLFSALRSLSYLAYGALSFYYSDKPLES